MNRGNSRVMFYSFPIAQVVPPKTLNTEQVVPPKTLNTEKNQLLSIMASYIAKETDREKALTDLTKLELTLKSS